MLIFEHFLRFFSLRVSDREEQGKNKRGMSPTGWTVIWPRYVTKHRTMCLNSDRRLKSRNQRTGDAERRVNLMYSYSRILNRKVQEIADEWNQDLGSWRQTMWSKRQSERKKYSDFKDEWKLFEGNHFVAEQLENLIHYQIIYKTLIILTILQ